MKISLDCSSQLELVEVVRTEESLGSVQGVFQTFFWSLLPSPRNVLLKSSDITQNTRNPSISFEMQTSSYNSSQFEPDKVFQATKSLGSVPTHFAIFLWSLLPSLRTGLLNSNEIFQNALNHSISFGIQASLHSSSQVELVEVIRATRSPSSFPT